MMNKQTKIQEDTELIKTIHDLALEGFEGPNKNPFESTEKFKWLREIGSRLWLDTGDATAAGQVWATETEALTTNNTLVNKVVQTGIMDGFITYAARKVREIRPDMSIQELVIELAFLVNAKLALDLVQRFGSHVSVELHPDLGFDVDRSCIYARRYYDICPDFFYVKVPMTPDGFVTVRKLSSENIPINYTLGFSARQNYLATLFSRPKFVNVFLGRLNSVVEENHIGSPENVGEKAALASNETVNNLREKDNSIKTEQIAASLRSGQQIVTLAGMDVLTIPIQAVEEYLDLDIRKDDIYLHKSQNLQVELNDSNLAKSVNINDLWDIDQAFIDFTQDAVSMGDKITHGDDLVELSHKHNINIFHNWTAADHQAIRKKGKIPDLSSWHGAPVDDLMSISALESFASDQSALDQRIKSLAQNV
ncbi:MAG: transaldolase family protein [Armatimonadota bacterium]